MCLTFKINMLNPNNKTIKKYMQRIKFLDFILQAKH